MASDLEQLASAYAMCCDEKKRLDKQLSDALRKRLGIGEFDERVVQVGSYTVGLRRGYLTVERVEVLA